MKEARGRMMRFPEARVYVREVGEGQPLLLINGWAPIPRCGRRWNGCCPGSGSSSSIFREPAGLMCRGGLFP
jgi:hypothetical protein